MREALTAGISCIRGHAERASAGGARDDSGRADRHKDLAPIRAVAIFTPVLSLSRARYRSDERFTIDVLPALRG
jgi:hypothetical protein